MEQVETKVDLLAVLDDVIDHAMNKPYRNCGSLCGLRLEDSRAAIVELIEALKDTRASLDNVGLIDTYIDFYAVQAAINRADAALARVGGGK